MYAINKNIHVKLSKRLKKCQLTTPKLLYTNPYTRDPYRP